MHKNEIISELRASHHAFWKTAISLPNPSVSVNNKWSVAQNVEHITIALQRFSNYLMLPKSDIKSKFGCTDRPSASMETIVKVFRSALENGIQTTKTFAPQLVPETSIGKLVTQGKEALAALILNMETWTEDDLDLYYCPHPVLGKITVREVLYFTAYHVGHHHETLKKMK